MKCETKSLGGFLYRISMCGFRYEYYRYVVRHIPEGKDLERIDQKLIDVYAITSCRMKRLRERRKGRASVQYIRFSHSFVLLATQGAHEAFDRLASCDARTTPLVFRDYTVGLKGNTPCVRVRGAVWGPVEARFSQLALSPKAEIERKLASLPYRQFPGVKSQFQKMLKSMNKRRRAAGLSLITIPNDKGCMRVIDRGY